MEENEDVIRVCVKQSDIEYPLYKYWIFYRFDINWCQM